MARIKIKDIPRNIKISEREMKEIKGDGILGSAWKAIKSLEFRDFLPQLGTGGRGGGIGQEQERGPIRPGKRKKERRLSK